MNHNFSLAKSALNFTLSATFVIAICSCATLFKSSSNSIKTGDYPQYWLKTSMFAGQFYDNKRVTLIDYRPFSVIDDAKTLDGYTIYPPNPNSIIRAGTWAKIKISYPDKKRILNRPIFSPKENIWVYFKVAKERGDVTIFEKQLHVMVLPKRTKSSADIKKYLGQFFSNRDPNRWILNERNFIQEAIWFKRPVVGMKKKHLLASLGPALSIEKKESANKPGQEELWHYNNYLIIFNNEILHQINKY